jgi:HPt (histidine-containing phosphotransfer) domain-containing protein
MTKIDIEKIANELEFEIDEVEMLVGLFIESAYEELGKMKNAIEKKDFETLYKSAHTIKGSAANLMLEDISTTAKQIEFDARSEIDKDYMSEYLKLDQAVKMIEETK